MTRPLLTPAVNATGVILHTGLGRAVLPLAARRAVMEITAGYCTLEIDTETGKRGSRHDIVRRMLCELTGAEAALVVNNNAAAVMLILNTLAVGRDVIVSRGQLVEIGGAFRMPDVMAQSGARLISVGATNHTTLDDYHRAITERTALLVAVHRSNFEVVGENVETPIEELAALGRETGIPVAHDLGSGALVDLTAYGIAPEPTVQASVAAGVGVTCFSGDKLLGGPQAGIVVGDAGLVAKMASNPLMRALRVDKMTLAALQATLALFLDDASIRNAHPVLRMLSEPVAALERVANRLAEQLSFIFHERMDISVEDDVSEIGGGSLPARTLPTKIVALTPRDGSNRDLADRFRRQTPPVFGRLSRDRFLMDVRTLCEDDIPAILHAAEQIAGTL